VLERTEEIGLRRAVGVRPRHIAAQFLAESTALGTLGGLIGTCIGVGTVVIFAAAKDWPTYPRRSRPPSANAPRSVRSSPTPSARDRWPASSR